MTEQAVVTIGSGTLPATDPIELAISGVVNPAPSPTTTVELASSADQAPATSAPFAIERPPPPVISSLSPKSGSTGGKTAVTITGTNLSGATAVRFGGSRARIVSDTDTVLQVTTPSHPAGKVAVVVVTPGGKATDRAAYDYVSPGAPSVTSVTPTSGPVTGGTTVTITGSNLALATVQFGKLAATVTTDDPGELVVTTPPHPAGVVPVSVTTPKGSLTDPGAYTYLSG